jgi:hypothetical protein
MSPVELLQSINALQQTTFTLVEQYPDGEQGAFAITDHLSRRCVLKWELGVGNLSKIQVARAVTDQLRNLGYPAPHYLYMGYAGEGMYSIQSALPGSPLRSLTTTLLPRLFELNELQVGRALDGQSDWHQEVINTVLSGGDGYCLHASLQQHSRGTANLLQELQALVIAHQAEPHHTNDIVHVDFQNANILMHDEQISGVIDWDGTSAGDRIFDVATLLFYSYDVLEVRKRLWDYVLKRASLKLLSTYFAHLILRQVDWSLRHHDQTTSERFIARGQMLLREVAHRSRSVD